MTRTLCLLVFLLLNVNVAQAQFCEPLFNPDPVLNNGLVSPDKLQTRAAIAIQKRLSALPSENFLEARAQIPVPEQKPLLETVMQKLRLTLLTIVNEQHDPDSYYNKNSKLKLALPEIIQNLRWHLLQGDLLNSQDTLRYMESDFFFYKSSYFLSLLSSENLKSSDSATLSDLRLAFAMIPHFKNIIDTTASFNRLKYYRRAHRIDSAQAEALENWNEYRYANESGLFDSIYVWDLPTINDINTQTANGIAARALSDKLSDANGFKNQLPFKLVQDGIRHPLDSFRLEKKDDETFAAYRARRYKLFNDLAKLKSLIDGETHADHRAYMEAIFYEATKVPSGTVHRNLSIDYIINYVANSKNSEKDELKLNVRELLLTEGQNQMPFNEKKYRNAILTFLVNAKLAQ